MLPDHLSFNQWITLRLLATLNKPIRPEANNQTTAGTGAGGAQDTGGSSFLATRLFFLDLSTLNYHL